MATDAGQAGNVAMLRSVTEGRRTKVASGLSPSRRGVVTTPAAPRAAVPRQDPTLVFVEIAFVLLALQIILGRDILFSLFASGTAGVAIDTESGNRDGSSNLLNAGPLLLTYLGSAVFLVLKRAYVPLLSRRHLPLFIFLALVVMSAAWSDSPGVSLRRSISLVGTTLVAAYIALAFPPRTALRLMVVSLAVFCVVSLALAVGVPSIGRHTAPPHAGLWTGMQLHKNELGRSVVIASVVFLLYFWGPRFDPRRLPILTASLALCVVLLAGAWSGTAIVVFCGLMFCFVLLRHIAGTNKLHFNLFLVGIIFATLMYSVAMYFFEDILTLLGKEPTLSGRTGIWQAAFGLGLEQPLFGYGYRTFWVGASAEEVYHRLGFGLQHVGGAHNGYLDLWLEMGLVGFLLVLWMFVVILWRGLKALAVDADALNMLPIMVLALVIVYAVSAGVIAEQGEMAWVVLMMAWFWLANERLPVGTSPLVGADSEFSPTSRAPRSMLRTTRRTTDLGRRWRNS